MTCAAALPHTTDRSVSLFHPQFSALFIVCDSPLGRDMEEQEGQVLCSACPRHTGHDTGGGCHVVSSLVPSLKEKAAPHKNLSLKSL